MNPLRFAWRNLWRNKRRTLITLSAIIFNTTILISNYALMNGMVKHAIENASNLVVGEAQIHVPGYLSERTLYKSIDNPDAIVDLAKSKGIQSAKRSYGYGLVAHQTKSAGAFFWGIEPQVEQSTFDLAKHLEKGSFLSEIPERGMVLGKKLARSLNVEIGDEIIVVVQAADGSLGNELYYVTGILKAAGENIDRNSALIHSKDFRELFVASNLVHEIAFNSRGKTTLLQYKTIFAPLLAQLELKTWRELLPTLSDMVNVLDIAVWIFGSIFFLVAALGVLNTMLMATYERVREFGILKALGTTPLQIVSDVCAEAFVLAGVATFFGMVLGLLLVYYFHVVGIDTTSFAGQTTIAGVAFDPIWRAEFSWSGVIFPVLTMCVICVLASLYPAIMAARLDPVKAIHHT